MAKSRIVKKRAKAASDAAESAQIDADRLLYIMEQVAAAHAYRDALTRQQAKNNPLASPGAGVPKTATPAKAPAGAPTTPGGKKSPALTPAPAPRKLNYVGVVENINKLFGSAGGPTVRGPAKTGIGRFHDNLAELPLAPLFIVIIVIALILLPVYQGYTRLDLLFMVLSGDASVPIPLRGAGQNYQQALASPPDQSQGTGGVGGWIWGHVVGPGVAGLAPGIIGAINGGFAATAPATTTTLSTPATGDSAPANDARAQQIAQQAMMPNPFAPGGGQVWVD